MKIRKRILAVLLAAVTAFSVTIQASAVSDSSSGEPYSIGARITDKALGTAHDMLFGVLTKLTAQKNIPSYDTYRRQKQESFFDGTDGKASGTEWSGGFANGSIIPPEWRCDANGKSDPNGSCLKTIHGTGGNQTLVSKLYTDQMLNMEILSCGSDENNNGVNDILIFVSIDGVGITAGTCDRIREAILKSLKSSGVCAADILGCNISATHCHAGLDVQGMFIPTLFVNKITDKLNPFSDYIRSLNKHMEDSICSQAALCAKKAYGKMEKGSLYFFETDEIDGCGDKLNCGAKVKNTFSCFLFEGIGGEKTILSNIGAHPVSYNAKTTQMLCTDYPYFMALALRDEGYNLVFTQSCQAAVTSPNAPKEYTEQNKGKANEWVKSRAFTRGDWVERYGEKYTKKWFDSLESTLEENMNKGFHLAHFILDSIDKSLSIKPSLNVKNSQTLLSLDYGIMAWGSVSGLLGERIVTTSKSETGYGVVAETNYLEFGEKVVVLTAPGELSPALVYGTDPNYSGKTLWNGNTSWTGKEWTYDTIKNIVCGKPENEGKEFVLMGITNDALGYMFPDNCTPESLLGTLLFYKDDPKHPNEMVNEMLMTVGTSCGSELTEAYIALAESVR